MNLLQLGLNLKDLKQRLSRLNDDANAHALLYLSGLNWERVLICGNPLAKERSLKY